MDSADSVKQRIGFSGGHTGGMRPFEPLLIWFIPAFTFDVYFVFYPCEFLELVVAAKIRQEREKFMLKTELTELILNGENSGVEFKRHDVHTDSLATEIVALLNLKGGHIFLGVEDNGDVTGLTRDAKAAEEWLMSVCRDRVQPSVIPY